MGEKEQYLLEIVIDDLTEKMKHLEYDFCTAQTFGDRKAIYIEYKELEKDRSNLMNGQGL